MESGTCGFLRFVPILRVVCAAPPKRIRVSLTHSLSLPLGPLRPALYKGSLYVFYQISPLSPRQRCCVADLLPHCRCRIHFPTYIYGRVHPVRVYIHNAKCPGLRNRSRRDPSARWRAGRHHSMKARLCLTASLLHILLVSPDLLRARDYFLNNYRLLHFLIHQSQQGCYILCFLSDDILVHSLATSSLVCSFRFLRTTFSRAPSRLTATPPPLRPVL